MTRRLFAALAFSIPMFIAAARATSAAPLLLVNGRFTLEARWSAGSQHDVPASSVKLTDNSGYFTFFDPSNVEVVVKVLDACQSASPRFWIFGAGLTNVEVTLDVVDTWSGMTETFHNPAGKPFAPLQRTDLFATCSTPQPCGQGNAADLARSPRPDDNAEQLALFLDGEIVARQGTYERVVDDLAAINQVAPELAGYSILPDYDTQSLIVSLDPDTSHAPGGPDWDCLNHWYGLTEIQNTIGGTYKVLKFDHRLLMPRVAEDYRRLAGIRSVELNLTWYIGEFPYQNLCALRSGNDAIVYYYTGGFAPWRQFRTHTGQPPVEEPFAEAGFAGCAVYLAP